MEEVSLSKQRGRLQPKSREVIKEAADIVRNSEDDGAAIDFLRNTLDDDFPDLDLGSMDLHEAIKVLGNEQEEGDMNAIKNLNEALGEFMNKQSKLKGNKKKGRRKRRRKRK